MVTTSLLATLLVTQGQGPLPPNAAVLYSGIPAVVAGRASDVRMTSHSVEMVLSKSTATVSSVSLFHNDSAKPVTVTLMLPITAKNPVIGRGWDIDFQVTLNGKPLTVSPWKGFQTLSDANGKPAGDSSETVINRYKQTTVTFGVRNTYVLRISYSVPVGKSELNGMQRLVAYETAGANTWKGPMDRLNFTIHYGPGVVFQVVTHEPEWGWQIGAKALSSSRTHSILRGMRWSASPIILADTTKSAPSAASRRALSVGGLDRSAHDHRQDVVRLD